MCSKGEVEIEFEFPTSNWGTGNPSHFRLETNPLDLINQKLMIYKTILKELKFISENVSNSNIVAKTAYSIGICSILEPLFKHSYEKALY